MYWRFVSVFVAIALSVNLIENQKKVNNRGQEYAAKAIAGMMIEKSIKNYFGSWGINHAIFTEGL